MAATTTYDVKLRYLMQDHASRGLRQLDKNLQRTTRSTGLLARGVAMAGGAIATAFGVRTAKKYLVDYNRQLEDAVTTMAGLINFTAKAGMERSFVEAGKAVKDLEQYAKVSTATTMEMVSFARETVQPLVQAGMATDRLAKFTARAVVAAKAFGDEQIAAFDIQQALTKGVEIRDRFMMKLLNAARMTKEEFNEMDKAGRLAFIEQQLNDPAIETLAKAQATTFSGLFSTFQDNLQIAGGQIGRNLFDKLTSTLERWNAWIAANGRKIEAWGESLGTSLVNAFGVLERVGKFFVDNSTLLLTLAKIWAGTKIVGGIGGMLGGGLASGGGLFRQMGGLALRKNMDGLGLKLASFGSSISSVGGALFSLAGAGGPIALAAGAFMGIYSWWSGKKEEEKRTSQKIDEATAAMVELLDKEAWLTDKRAGLRAGMPVYGRLQGDKKLMDEIYKDEQADFKAMRPQAQAAVARFAGKYGLLAEDDKSVEGRYRIRNFTPAGAQTLGFTPEQYTKLAKVFDAFNKQLKENVDAQLALAKVLDPQEQGIVLPTVNEKDNTGAGDTNVTIQKIEVESNDPDRFVFGLTEAIRDYRKNPGQSAFAGFEGG